MPTEETILATRNGHYLAYYELHEIPWGVTAPVCFKDDKAGPWLRWGAGLITSRAWPVQLSPSALAAPKLKPSIRPIDMGKVRRSSATYGFDARGIAS